MGSLVIAFLRSLNLPPLSLAFFNMMHRAPLQFIIILLSFSYLLSSTAVPTTRSLLSSREESSNVQTTTFQGDWEFGNGEGMFGMGEESLMMEERMDLESSAADYPGTGANNHHNPPRAPATPPTA